MEVEPFIVEEVVEDEKMSDGILVGSWKEIFLPPSPQNFMTGIASGAVSGAVSGIAFAVVYDMGEVVVRMYRGRQARNRAVGSQVVPRDIAGVSLGWKVIFVGVLWLCSKCAIVCRE